MAETRTQTMNKPGWLDLSSKDSAASREFYSQLFGWTAEVVSDPAAGGYGMFRVDGKEVGGVGPTQSEQQPTGWTMHILVEDADDAVRRAREAGATVLAEPSDVMGEGRMAMLADPSAAVFGVWQPMRHGGWEMEGAPGSVCWLELQSRDLKAAADFYEAVFGWEPTKLELPGQGYTTFALHRGGDAFAGGMSVPDVAPRSTPSFWQPYIGVTDTDSAVERAARLGATVVAPPQDAANVGRWAVLQDPQGAMFGVLTPPEGGPAQ